MEFRESKFTSEDGETIQIISKGDPYLNNKSTKFFLNDEELEIYFINRYRDGGSTVFKLRNAMCFYWGVRNEIIYLTRPHPIPGLDPKLQALIDQYSVNRPRDVTSFMEGKDVNEYFDDDGAETMIQPTLKAKLIALGATEELLVKISDHLNEFHENPRCTTFKKM